MNPRPFLVTAAVVLIAIGCWQAFSPNQIQHAAPLSGPPPTTTLNSLLASLRPGMSEDEFDRVVGAHLFIDGFVMLPIIVSISDRNRHFNIPPVGPIVFYFDDQRRLSSWEAWTVQADGTWSHDNGSTRATLSVSK